MKRITKVHNTMQHMLLNLLCYSWPAVTGEPNKGKCSREVTSISFGNVPFSCFCHFWISDCMSHVWKCRSYNSDFCASQGQILSPRRKLSRMKKKKRKKKKRKRNQNVVQQKANLNMHRAVLRMHSWVSLAGLSLTRKPNLCVCVCGFVKNRFSKSKPLRIFWRGWKYPLKCQNSGKCTL